MRITDSDPQSRLQQSDIASKISPDKRMQMDSACGHTVDERRYQSGA